MSKKTTTKASKKVAESKPAAKKKAATKKTASKKKSVKKAAKKTIAKKVKSPCEQTISQKAQEIYQHRCANGIDGCAESDWYAAIESLKS